MSNRDNRQPNPEKVENKLNPLVILSKIVAASIIGIIAAVFIECIFLFTGLVDEHHALNQFNAVLHWFDEQLINQESHVYINWIDQNISLDKIASKIGSSSFPLIQSWMDKSKTYIISSCFVILTALIKLFVVIFYLPIFLLLTAVSITDGLVLRDIRKADKGLDSGRKYALTKKLIWPAFMISWIFFLIIPIAIPPILLLFTPSVFFLFLVRTWAHRLNKHW